MQLHEGEPRESGNATLGSSLPRDARLLPESPDSPELARLRMERDLYRTLVELGSHASIESMTEVALELVARISGARKGYLEIFDERDTALEPMRWSVSSGCSDAELVRIRDVISRGIIAEAVASGEPVVTASALLDDRFRDRGSVQRNQIEAVLCVPVRAESVIGVLYLQERVARGPFSNEEVELCVTVARCLAVFAERLLVKHRLDEGADPTLEHRRSLRLPDFVGKSPALAETLAQVALVAPLDVSVMLTGESGTGKTALARILHDNSPRASQPFVELNCAAIPEQLLESELFGALPGSHSTASHRIWGKLDAARHGTVFLDEVSELTPATQAKLLQFLQSREYFPLGSGTPSRADVRVFAASNVDLHERVAEKRFREDLLYRLEVLPIRMPALAERTEDIAELMRFFCARACKSHGFGRLEVSPAALHAAALAEWPGNVRQLAHAVEAATIRAVGSGSSRIELEHVFPTQHKAVDGKPALTYQQATRQFQERLLRETLAATGWNVTQTAERLDVARSHVYKLIRSFGLEKSID